MRIVFYNMIKCALTSSLHRDYRMNCDLKEETLALLNSFNVKMCLLKTIDNFKL